MERAVTIVDRNQHSEKAVPLDIPISRPDASSMEASRHPKEYAELAKKLSTADIEPVCQNLREKGLAVLPAPGPQGDEKSVDLQAGIYLGSRFDCLVTISFSRHGNLCLVSHSLGRTQLPSSVDLDGILSRTGWRQVPDDDITVILDEKTDADVMDTFFNMF